MSSLERPGARGYSTSRPIVVNIVVAIDVGVVVVDAEHHNPLSSPATSHFSLLLQYVRPFERLPAVATVFHSNAVFTDFCPDGRTCSPFSRSLNKAYWLYSRTIS